MSPEHPASTMDFSYDTSMDAIYLEAWQKTKETTAIFWQGLVSIVLIMVVTTLLTPTLISIITSNSSITDLLTTLIQIGLNIMLLTPLLAGLFMMCIKHCAGVPTPINTLFKYFPYWKRLSIFPIVMMGFGYAEDLFSDFAVIQTVIMVFSGLWAITYFMYIPLAIEKNLPINAVMQISRKAVTQHWTQVFAFLLTAFIILFVTIFTLGIGLIWTLPWICNAAAIFYRELFGIQFSLV